MSLINDALKQARKAPPRNAPSALPALQPVADESSSVFAWLVPAIVILLIVAAIFFIGWAVAHHTVHTIATAPDPDRHADGRRGFAGHHAGRRRSRRRRSPCRTRRSCREFFIHPPRPPPSWTAKPSGPATSSSSIASRRSPNSPCCSLAPTVRSSKSAWATDAMRLRKLLAGSPLAARVAPFVIFVLLTAAQGKFGAASAYWFYLAKTLAGLWLIFEIRPLVAEMRWAFSWEAVAVGVGIFAIWVGVNGEWTTQNSLVGETRPFASAGQTGAGMESRRTFWCRLRAGVAVYHSADSRLDFRRAAAGRNFLPLVFVSLPRQPEFSVRAAEQIFCRCHFLRRRWSLAFRTTNGWPAFCAARRINGWCSAKTGWATR